MKLLKNIFITVLFAILLNATLIQPVIADNNKVLVEFFYTNGCNICDEKKPIIDNIEQEHMGKVSVQKYFIVEHPKSESEKENYTNWETYGFNFVPGVVIKNSSNNKYARFKYDEIIEKNVNDILNKYLAGNDNENPKAIVNEPYNDFVNSSISFSALDSFDPDGDEILSYSWDFDDSDGIQKDSIEQNPTHVYLTNGTYTVTLTVTDSVGLTDRHTTYAHITEQSENKDTPGFEIILALFAITIILFYKKRKHNI